MTDGKPTRRVPSFLRHRSLVWIAEAGRALSGFVILALLARILDPDLLGAYLAVLLWVAVLPRTLDLGLPMAFAYFVRVEPGASRRFARLVGVHVAASVPVVVGLVFALEHFPFAGPLPGSMVSEIRTELALVLLADLFVLIASSMFIPGERYLAYLLAVLTAPAILVAALVVMLSGAPEAITPVDVFDRVTLGSLLAAGVTLGLLLVAPRSSTAAITSIRSVYGYGLRSYGAAIAKILSQRFDRIYLATLLGSTGYAYFSLASSIRDMAVFPPGLHALTLRNRQIDLAREGPSGLRTARGLLLRASWGWGSLCLGGAVVALLFWEGFIGLFFGMAMQPAAPFAGALAFSAAPIAVMNFSWNHLYAIARPERVTSITVGSLAFGAALFPVCTSFLDPAPGAVVAVLCWSYGTAAASLLLAMRSIPATHEGR